MKIEISPSAPSALATNLLVVLVADNGDKTPVPELLASDPVLQSLAAPLIAAEDLTGKFAECVWLLSPASVDAQRILFLGAGKRDQFCTTELRKLAGAAARAAKSKNIKSLVFVLPPLLEAPDAAQAATEGIITGDFDVDTYRSDRKDLQLSAVILAIPDWADAGAAYQSVAEGAIIAESQNFARALALEPSNFMTPTILAERARDMCQETGLACEVYGPDKIKELKMGAFLSVSQGSEEEPRLVVIRYEPEAQAPAAGSNALPNAPAAGSADAPAAGSNALPNAPAAGSAALPVSAPVLGLVGKGITFDSGGISIKPADGMEKMKYDMSGAAIMLGAMRAIALLKPNRRVLAVLCCSENMLDGKAQKPGDVQFAMNGTSIEVINTDAEGRLVLADGLCYARQLGATHLIDAATLTGAVVVALGYHNVGVFSNNDAFADAFAASTIHAGEKMWRLPVDQDYFDHIRSEIADIKNTGGRWGGAITAALFLKEFVDGKPWIHLDIAGTAWLEEAKAWMPKGPSGIAVRSLVDFARTFSGGESK
jgi:leucyl aminopeptidase